MRWKMEPTKKGRAICACGKETNILLLIGTDEENKSAIFKAKCYDCIKNQVLASYNS